MDCFQYIDQQLHAEEVPLSAVAEQFGTPCFVYARAAIEHNYRAFDAALGSYPHLLCYAVKANSNLSVLSVLARLGSGFDIVSGGELARVLAAGGDPSRVVFSGVGKRADEIRSALLAGIRCFNVESVAELLRIESVAAQLQRVAAISVRVNPDVDAGTHPYISTGLRENKFGVPIEQALDVYLQAVDLPHLRPVGMDCHIGSQLTDLTPYEDALQRLLVLTDQLADRGVPIHHLDMGGGLGIRYRDERPPLPGDLAAVLLKHLRGRDLELIVEPGRALLGNAGILLTRVEHIKRTPDKRFAIVDAAMNDLLRPALYSAWQEIIPVHDNHRCETELWDIVGPVCESADFLGRDRQLAVAEGDLLAVRSCGAYGFVMSSNYNARPRAAEVMVDGGRASLVRRRERIEDLYAAELPLAPL